MAVTVATDTVATVRFNYYKKRQRRSKNYLQDISSSVDIENSVIEII